MSIWSKLLGFKQADDTNHVIGKESVSLSTDSSRCTFVDVEIGLQDHKIHDIGALRFDGAIFHQADREELVDFLRGSDYLCGHNIIHHDAKYLFAGRTCYWPLVDTLYVSPLLFPERPYHRLVKDDKLVSEQLNNPVNDCEKAKDLLFDEVAHWNDLPEKKQQIWAYLLKDQKEFTGFLQLVQAVSPVYMDPVELIRDFMKGESASRQTCIRSLKNILSNWRMPWP